MIAKLSTGNGFGGATSYLLRKGKSSEERSKVKILAVSGVDFDYDPNGCITLDVQQVARDFRFQAMMRPLVRKPVYCFALSWKVGEHVPSEEKLARCHEFMQMIGFDNTQFVIIEHEKENEHSHILANIVDYDGNRISTERLIERMHAAAREITKKYGYQWGETAKKETIKKAYKPHERARYTIEPVVKEAVAKTEDIQGLPELLRPFGIGCNIRYSEARKPDGISFSVELDGQLHTFKGRDLDRSLSAGNIVKSITDKIEERNRPMISFDFKAALQQNAVFAASSQATSATMATPSINTVDISSVFLTAKDKDSLELALLDKKVVVKPIKDRFGGVYDFRVTLASEGRVVNASDLVPEGQMRQMVDRWETLTGEVPAYKLEKRRENQKKLADICRKMDMVSPENAPRIPRRISFLPGGEIEVFYYDSGRHVEQSITVDNNGKLRLNGLILDINTGECIKLPGQSLAPQQDQEESPDQGYECGI